MPSTSRLLVAIVNICKDVGDWKLLNEQVIGLSKKHGQLKQATTKMVQVAMGLINETPTLDIKLALIDTLRTVTEGKVFGSISSSSLDVSMLRSVQSRFLLKLREPESLVPFQTLKNHKETSIPPPIFYASYKWKRSGL